MDFDVQDYLENSWGRVLMYQYHGGENQKWIFEGNQILCKYNLSLTLDDFQNEGKKPGMYKKHGGPNQKWHCVGK